MKRYLYFILHNDELSLARAVKENKHCYSFDNLISPAEVIDLMIEAKSTKGCVVVDTKCSYNDSSVWEELSYFYPPMFD